MDHFYQDIPGWFDFEDVYKAFVETAADGSHFVEVGAWYGKSAAFMAVEIFNSKKNIKFSVVDHWLGSIEHQKGEFAEENHIVSQASMFPEFCRYMAPVMHLINPIQKGSISGSEDFADKSLELVFLDASHLYEDVRQDIEAWYPKIKSNGIIAGHDFSNSWPGVVKAVTEFEPFRERDIIQAGHCWVHHKA